MKTGACGVSSEACRSFEILRGKVSRPLRSLELSNQSCSPAQVRSPAQFDKRLSSTPVDASHFILRLPSPQLEPLLPPKNSILVRVCFTNLVQSGEELIPQLQPHARKNWSKVAVVACGVARSYRWVHKRNYLEVPGWDCNSPNVSQVIFAPKASIW